MRDPASARPGGPTRAGEFRYFGSKQVGEKMGGAYSRADRRGRGSGVGFRLPLAITTRTCLDEGAQVRPGVVRAAGRGPRGEGSPF